jgi:hypothetical protein
METFIFIKIIDANNRNAAEILLQILEKRCEK